MLYLALTISRNGICVLLHHKITGRCVCVNNQILRTEEEADIQMKEYPVRQEAWQIGARRQNLDHALADRDSL